ncbi:DUF2089 domain-containing protein [bacterium]|nr:DUF2089 domain-containing protein [bacterium]
MITRCPICEGKLEITGVHCKKCGTTISGHFPMSDLMDLTSEQMEFMKVFIKCRGNIKEVEKELNISYPTVRSKLDDLIRALGFQPHEDERYGDILEKLDKKELSVEEAIKLIKSKIK